MKVVTAQEMREIDRIAIEEWGIPGVVLMERAGLQVFRVMKETYRDLKGKLVIIFAGKGNNGGDGLVLARHLAIYGTKIKIVLLASRDKLSGDAKINFDIVSKMGLEINELTSIPAFDKVRKEIYKGDLLVDAIFGTGLTSVAEGIYAEAIKLINESKIHVVSIDIPSGLSADDGLVLGKCIQADLTVTFALPKRGHLLYPGVDYVGKLEVVDIGILPEVIAREEIKTNLITREEVASLFSAREAEGHKGTYGHVVVVAGSVGRTGAAVLTSMAALRMGAGLTTLIIPKSLNSIMEIKLTEVMTKPVAEAEEGAIGLLAEEEIYEFSKDKRVIAIGPGLSTHHQTTQIVRTLVEKMEIPMVIDADGVNALAIDIECLDRKKVPIVITPHPGEMANLLGIPIHEVQQNRLHIVQKVAKKHDIYVVLKGARTIISDPKGNIYINLTGNPGMATAGTGDVLTGMIASLIAQGFEIIEAVKVAVYLHGVTGDMVAEKKGQMSLIAGDLLEDLPKVIKQYECLSYKSNHGCS